MKLDLEEVSVSFGQVVVVDSVCLSIATGGWLALVGPNGSGKTTLLRSIVGLVEHAGQIRLDGSSDFQSHRKDHAQTIAYVPQRPQLPTSMTVTDYVLLGRTPYIGFFGTEGRRDRLAVARVLERLELAHLRERTLAEISGGEAQRAVLARALVQEAPVLVMDEPTTGLDLGHQQRVLELTDEMRTERGLTVLCAMHDLTVAGQYADRLALLVNGRVVAVGTPEGVLTEENLERHFAASVAVIDHAHAGTVVAPNRRRRAFDHRTEVAR